MQQRHIVWLVGTLIVLLGVAFLAGTFDSEISTIDVPSVGIPGDEIDSIEIIMSDSTTLSLARSETGWRLTSPVQARADSITLDRFTENLGDMAFETVVSTNEERYGTYGVAEGAKKVTASWNNSAKTFFVGNTGPDFQSFYVRMEGDPRVFLTNGRLNIPDNIDTWRDKVVMNLPAVGLSQVIVTGPDFSYEATGDGSSWQIASGDAGVVAGDSLSVSQWLRRFAPLRAVGFLDDKPASEVKAEAAYQLNFTAIGGSTQTLWLLEMENDLAATISGSDVTYRLSKGMLDSYAPTVDKLTGL